MKQLVFLAYIVVATAFHLGCLMPWCFAADAPDVLRRNPQEPNYADRTDSVDRKLAQFRTAYKSHDYKLARALAESIRQTIQFEQAELEAPGATTLQADNFVEVSSLPEEWRNWVQGWRFAKAVEVVETADVARMGEPVEFLAAFRRDQSSNLQRELRVARVDSGRLREIRSQVTEEVCRGDQRICRITFFADAAAGERASYLILYGNQDAELPEYPTDLKISGEGFGLDFENEYYKAALSRQMGQLERLSYKREHGQELFAGGEGHGEPPGIDWAHDYVTAGNFQKLRITNWPTCPDYEVIRGPLSLTVRRWGFPYSPLHPVFTPSRMNIYVEYRFYAGTPWFLKSGYMQVIDDIQIGYLRDDEWVFSGMSFNESLWMGSDGKLHVGSVPPDQTENLWGVGFFHRETRDAFIGLFLEHTAENAPPLKHTGSPTLHYKWHGHVWSRALYNNTMLKSGAMLRQRNAYLTSPLSSTNGMAAVENLRNQLMHPLHIREAHLGTSTSAEKPAGRLARPGEAGDAPIAKRELWKALEDCKDEQLYASKPSIVELGLVRDIRVRGDTVHVVMSTTGRGRPRVGFFSFGSGGNDNPVRELLLKVPGVSKVVVEQSLDSEWSSNRLSEEGRRKLGL